MQEEYGMAGVRFWMSWLALIIATLIVRQHRIGLAIIGLATAVWAACAIRFVIRKVKAGANLQSLDDDIDLVLCVVALAFTAAVPVFLLAIRLHIGPRHVLPLILAFAGFSAAWQSWRRGRKV
jgi:hypothetical protein